MTTQAQLEATMEALVPMAKKVWRERDALDLQTKTIICEIAGLFDAIAGVCYTNAEDRARHHLEVLDKLLNELPTVGIRPINPKAANG